MSYRSCALAVLASLVLASLTACGEEQGAREEGPRVFTAERDQASPAPGPDQRAGPKADEEASQPKPPSAAEGAGSKSGESAATTPTAEPSEGAQEADPLESVVAELFERIATSPEPPKLLVMRKELVAAFEEVAIGDEPSRKAAAHRFLFQLLEGRKARGGKAATSAASARARKAQVPSFVESLRGELASISRDPIAGAVEDILTSVVVGRATKDDYEELRRKLQRTLEGQQLGDGPARMEAADVTIANMFREFERNGGRATPGLTPLQQSAIVAKSKNIASDLYRRLPYRGTGKRHDGRLLKQSVAFEVPKGYEEISWNLLGGFTYEEGGAIPDEVMQLGGKKIGVAGYMLTLEQTEDIREFLLVESLWSCCFGTPPEVHEVLVVTIPKDWKRGVEYSPEALGVLGKIDVGEEIEDGFVSSLYRISLDKVLGVD